MLAFAGGRLQAFTIAWDVEQRRWFNLYPDEKIAPMDPLHWTALAAGRTGAPAAVPALSRLVQDASQPAVARATALDLLSESGMDREGLAAALTDPAPLVRAAAARAGTTLTDERKLALLAPLLRDPFAHRGGAHIGNGRQPAWDAAQREAFAAALRGASELRPTDPDVLYALIAFYTRQGQRKQARAHAERLVQFYPDVPEFQRLAESLRQ